MKILLTADPEIPVPPALYGGIERIVDGLVRGYISSGHSVTLFAHEESKVPCKLIPWRGRQSGGIRNIVANASQLFSHVRKENFDVIHSFSRLAYLTPVLPLAVPKIMSYQREPTLSQIKRALSLARKGSLLFTGCSNYITDQIKPLAPAATVYNYVPIERYDFVAEVAEDAPLIFLGRIEPIKGTHIAVQIAQEANRQLIIAGNIPTEGITYFEQQIKPHLNDRIRYVGPVNDEQKNAYLGQSAAFLMPIQWNEPFGIVMAEAMACGTPVIGFPFGAVPEVVDDGLTGFLCHDFREMLESVQNIRSINRNEVRKAAETRFTDRKIIEDYLTLYNNQIGSRHKSVFIRS